MGFGHVYPGFIVSIKNSTLSRVGLSSEFSKYLDKIPLRILHDVLCRVFRFFKASFNALTSQLIEFYNFVGAILALRRTEGCHGNSVISHDCEIIN